MNKVIIGLSCFLLGLFSALGVISLVSPATVTVVQQPNTISSGNITLMGSVQKADIAKVNVTNSSTLASFLNNDADGTKRVIREIVFYSDNLAFPVGSSIQAGTSTNPQGTGANLNAWAATLLASSTSPGNISTSTYSSAINRIWPINTYLTVSSTQIVSSTGYIKVLYDKIPQ